MGDYKTLDFKTPEGQFVRGCYPVLLLRLKFRTHQNEGQPNLSRDLRISRFYFFRFNNTSAALTVVICDFILSTDCTLEGHPCAKRAENQNWTQMVLPT